MQRAREGRQNAGRVVLHYETGSLTTVLHVYAFHQPKP